VLKYSEIFFSDVYIFVGELIRVKTLPVESHDEWTRNHRPLTGTSPREV
jgi:hypothetical protein